MKTKSLSLFVFTALILSSCAEEESLPSPISETLAVSAEQHDNILEVIITSTERAVTINSVIINNGECHSSLKLTTAEKQKKYKQGNFNIKQKAGFPLVINRNETRVVQSNTKNCLLEKVGISTTEGDYSRDW